MAQPVRKSGRLWRRIALWIVCPLVTLALGAFALLWIWSPGKTAPILGADGKALPDSIAEIVRMDIGGVEQAMIIRGQDVSNPVLLFLHGGPGSPEYPFAREVSKGMEEMFTVCWWDQRGSGMSYSPTIPPESMTVDQLVADTAEVSRYLMDRFGVDTVYLMGHSWGTFLGVHAAQANPDLYAAYIGMGQICYQYESEKAAYDYMLAQAKATGNTALQKKLEAFTLNEPSDLTDAYMQVRSDGMNELGIGLKHVYRSYLSDLVLPLLTCREYTLAQKFDYLKGMAFSNETLWMTVPGENLRDTVPKLDMPVYILQGVYDYQVSYTGAQAYFEVLEAPSKQFFTFEQSAHSPLLEEPERFLEILREDVLGSPQ